MSAYSVKTLAGFIRPTYPPNISANGLVPNTTRKGNVPKKTSNAASPVIAELWAKEPQLVKNEYNN
ncbi:24_t:CDS:2 [Ambispora gerdemannii]|uniref:24_t:CDS:1 n=1 Tax=Ambispora gerdemannii TaxID=144530 RepID=A0A9N8YZV1_9GLOM|nr:24_t:CDS:2 [Ambispora gerdemannii]